MSRIKQVFLVFAIVISLALPVSTFAWTPNDPLNYQQWGLGALGMGDAWDLNCGGRPDVKVAVIDTGVAWDLPDFAQTRFDRENAWDYVDGDAIPYDDGVGHGSHVTATIAQSTNNGIGASGIAFNVTILPIRALTEEGGSNANVASAIIRAADAGADIINLSLGSYFGTDELYSACSYAYSKGSLLVAATGNSYPAEHWADVPAWYISTLAVGAVDSGFNKAGFSQWAWDYRGPGVVAPGVNIIQELNEYGGTFKSGTSMAAPHVSGVAALVLSEAYDLGLSLPAKGTQARADWIRDIITSTTLDLGPSGADLSYGYGLVRADNALRKLQELR